MANTPNSENQKETLEIRPYEDYTNDVDDFESVRREQFDVQAALKKCGIPVGETYEERIDDSDED